MHPLQFRFRKWLYGMPEGWEHRGLVFHRWLPNGRADQIKLPTGDDDAEMFVWVERRGNVEEGRLVDDPRGPQIAPEIIARQGAIEVRWLHGELKLKGISTADFHAVTSHAGVKLNEREDGDYYPALGKRVYKILYGALKPFIDLLRFGYGQHWLDDLEPWDSRTYSLGHYLVVNFSLEWSSDSGDTWHPFLPTIGPINLDTLDLELSGPFWDFLAESDWEQIRQHVNEPYKVTTSHEVLSLAHALRDEGNYRHALIESVTALEIAIDAYLDDRLKRSPDLAKATQQLRGEGRLPLRLSAVVLSLPASTGDIALTFKTIEARNAIVHEAASPPDNARDLLDATFRIVASLLPGFPPRFPDSYLSGVTMSPEQWDAAREAYESGML